MNFKPDWLRLLRATIKRDHGLGWLIVEQADKVKFIRRRGSESSTFVSNIPWGLSCTSEVIQTIGQLRELMETRGLTLAQAGKLTQNKEGSSDINWENAAKDFLALKAGHRTFTRQITETRIKKVLRTLNASPRPTNAQALYNEYAKVYFHRCPEGGVGRRRHFGDMAAFLTHAVNECGADRKWLPLKGDKLDVLIGNSDRTSEKLTPPVKDDDLHSLLDSLRSSDRPDLYLAVGLVSLFGLRPAELAALRVDDNGMLWVGGQVKRNKRTMKNPKPDRFVFPIDIPTMRGEGQRLLKLYSSGLQKLPFAILTAIQSGELKAVGDAFRQLLDRYEPWQSLVAANPGVTPYSLRHSYAWRGTKSYERQIPSRDLAAMMGHTLLIHQRHYGAWTDQMSALASVTKAIGTNPLTADV